MEINQIVIVGSGPVGSFMAVLVTKLGFPVIVYEKRKHFTRMVNVKINKNLFLDVQSAFDKLGIASTFFKELNNELDKQHTKILIKTLEEKFKSEAEAAGAKYVVTEVKHFGDVYERHKDSNPLILDCSGRNSCLRTSTFGEDVNNIAAMSLDSMVYLNMTSDVVSTDISLYPAMMNIKHIKLARLLRCKREDGFTSVTIVASIEELLAEIFDIHCHDINRKPLRPFDGTDQPVSSEIFHTIGALISPLMLQGNSVKLDSVEVKKINITCGYAKYRSQGRLVCLGDAAIHLAYFKSLNIGLKHALLFFHMLAEYCKTSGVVTHQSTLKQLSLNHPRYRDHYVLGKFVIQNPQLNPVQIDRTVKEHVFMVVTKVVWFGCYSFDVKHSITRQLTSSLGIYKRQIPGELEKLNLALENAVPDKEYKRRVADLFLNDAKMLKIGVVANPVDVQYTVRKDNYMIVTKGLWYGCFWYNTASHEIERLTGVSGVHESQIVVELAKLNDTLLSWDVTLQHFEVTRQRDIQDEISSNMSKQSQYDFAAGAISLASQTGLKFYEVYSHLHRGYAIYPGDNDFFTKCLSVVREHAISLKGNSLLVDTTTLSSIQELAKLAELHHKSAVLIAILSCQVMQLPAIRKLVKRGKVSKKGGLFQNGEIKLEFAMSCIAYILKHSPHEDDVDDDDVVDDDDSTDDLDEQVDDDFTLISKDLPSCSSRNPLKKVRTFLKNKIIEE